MRLLLLTVGKPRLAYARAGLEEYLGRLRGLVEWKTVKAGTPASESAALLEASRGCLRVLLDESGQSLTSRGLAALWDAWERRAIARAAFLIGGAEGHTADLRAAADFIWSLSSLTLQHELAAIVTLEQLYRAHTLRTGHPYHRD
jgi:23S rRNA (pseudouridine1915-N3)-methyltransferase